MKEKSYKFLNLSGRLEHRKFLSQLAVLVQVSYKEDSYKKYGGLDTLSAQYQSALKSHPFALDSLNTCKCLINSFCQLSVYCFLYLHV